MKDNKMKSPFLDDNKIVFTELKEERVFSDENEELMPFPSDNTALIKTLSKIGLFFAIYFAIAMGGGMLLGKVAEKYFAQFLEVPWQRSLLIFLVNDIPPYVVGLPILAALLSTIKNGQKSSSFPTLQMTPKLFFKDLSVGYVFMYIGNFVSVLVVLILSAIKGADISNALNAVVSTSPTWLLIVFIGILPPILEELVFRKMIYKKLIAFGELPYILTSGVIFGLFHGNLHQVLYAFLLGSFFALLYARTEKIIIPMLMHAIINLINGVLVGKAAEIWALLPTILSIPILAFTVYGLVNATKHTNRIEFARSESTPQCVPKVMAKSWGMWVYALVCLAIIVYNTVA